MRNRNERQNDQYIVPRHIYLAHSLLTTEREPNNALNTTPLLPT
jgi:hypothetical protein